VKKPCRGKSPVTGVCFVQRACPSRFQGWPFATFGQPPFALPFWRIGQHLGGAEGRAPILSRDLQWPGNSAPRFTGSALVSNGVP